MLTDTHCHPFDISRIAPQAEQERRSLNVTAAASACTVEEFTHNETLAHNAVSEKAAPLILCFGIHPQLPAVKIKNSGSFTKTDVDDSIAALSNLAEAGRLSAIGECGFDLYNTEFKETEKAQDTLFAAHLEIAIKYGLPVVFHIRRAMHKVFNDVKTLSKCRSVVFHSWSGTFEEARSLLRRGVNAYFSFGNVIMLNHKQAIQCCSLLPVERLLTETDSPYQPRRNEKYSTWADLPLILKTAANLRIGSGSNIDVNDLEARIEANFRKNFYEEKC